MAVQLWTTTPTINDDFIIGGAGASNIDGGTGLAVVQGKGTVVWGSKTGVYATTSP